MKSLFFLIVVVFTLFSADATDIDRTLKFTFFTPKDELFHYTKKYYNRQGGFLNSIKMEFVKIKGGHFMMGLNKKNCIDKFGKEKKICKQRDKSDELPRHKVYIKPFYIQTTEVTQYQWYLVMGKNPSYFKARRIKKNSKNFPVESVNLKDINKFISRLNKIENSRGYRLPTEEEWEYVARAGKDTMWSFGNDEKKLKEYAWYCKNSNYKTHQVRSKKPNRWGIYDMYGNVWEWTCSNYTKNYNSTPMKNIYVLRGGAWTSKSTFLSNSNRGFCNPNARTISCGFRLVYDKNLKD